MTNAPDRYERFVVPEGVKKCGHEPPLQTNVCLRVCTRPGATARTDQCVVPYRIAVEKDTKVAHAAKFTLQREDHTIGNLLRM